MKFYFLKIYYIILLLVCCSKISEREVRSGNELDILLEMQIILEENEKSFLGECDQLFVKNHIYYGDAASNQVVVFNLQGKQIRRIGKSGLAPDEVADLQGFYVNNDYIFILDGNRHKITIYDTLGNFIDYQKILQDGKSFLYGPNIVVKSDNSILISEQKVPDSSDPNALSEHYQKTWLITEYADKQAKKHFGHIDAFVLENHLNHPPNFIGSPVIFLNQQDNLFLCQNAIAMVHQYDPSGQLVNRMDMHSPSFRSVFEFREAYRSNVGKISWISAIGFIEKQNVVLMFHFNRNSDKSLSDQFTQYYLNVFDLKTNTLYADINLTSFVKRKDFPITAIGPGGYFYLLTDDTPEQVTISKFRIQLESK